MRHYWVRDVADFAKYGLLKRLVGDDLSLGVIWWLTSLGDPRDPVTSYLSREVPNDCWDCDAALFGILKQIHVIRGSSSTLKDIETSKALPAGTTYFSQALDTTSLPHVARSSARQGWFQRARDAVADRQVVFLDPDTGLLPPNRKVENRHGEEYATPQEVISFVQRGQSAVVVQFGAPGNFESEPEIARARLAALTEAALEGGHPRPFGLWWRDGHKVGLLVAPSAAHSERLAERRAALLADPAWSKKIIPL